MLLAQGALWVVRTFNPGNIPRLDAIALDGTVSVQSVGDHSLHTIHIHGDEVGYAGGDAGQVLITEDGGLTWRMGPNVGRSVRGVDGIGFNHR